MPLRSEMAGNHDTSPNSAALVRGLSRYRARQGVTLEQIAESTKINIRFLRAIEGEEFEQLPGGIFSTSYIRQYADAVGLDPNDLLERYYERVGSRTSHRPPPATNGFSHRRTALSWFRAFKI